MKRQDEFGNIPILQLNLINYGSEEEVHETSEYLALLNEAKTAGKCHLFFLQGNSRRRSNFR